MAKRKICENKPGMPSGVEVRSVGWGSSSLDEAHSSPHPIACENALRTWETNPASSARTGRGETELHQGIAQLMACNNRRHQPRLAQSAEIRIRQFSCELSGVIVADLQNLSRGGICIASRVPLLRSSVVQCEIGVPNLLFAIPTLMQVVWVEETGASQYEVGLRYLF
jgi:hypothetical protein